MVKGKFIVFEGIDLAGKTTIIKEIIEENKRFIYNKSTVLDKETFKKTHPSLMTIKLLLQLIKNTYSVIRKKLKQNKIILQDRYFNSITTYVPEAKKFHNKIIFMICKLFIQNPNMLIHMTVEHKERIKRIKKDQENPHHKELIKNPQLLIMREKEMVKEYNNFSGKKMIIDTTNKTIKETKKEILEFMNISQ